MVYPEVMLIRMIPILLLVFPAHGATCGWNDFLKNLLTPELSSRTLGPDLTDSEKFKAYFDTRIETITPIQNQGCWGSCHLQADMAVVTEAIGGSAIDTEYLLGARQYSRTMEALKNQYAWAKSVDQSSAIERFISKPIINYRVGKQLGEAHRRGGNEMGDLMLLMHWSGKRVDAGSVPVFKTIMGSKNITHPFVKMKYEKDLRSVFKKILNRKMPMDQAVDEVNAVYRNYFGEVFIDRAVSSSSYRSATIRRFYLVPEGSKKALIKGPVMGNQVGEITVPVVRWEGKHKKVSEFRTKRHPFSLESNYFTESELSDYLIHRIGVEKKPLSIAMPVPHPIRQALDKGTFEELNEFSTEGGWHQMYVRGLKTEMVNGTKRVTGLEVANSWGEKSGVGGEIYVPFEKLKKLDFNLSEIVIDY